ncbi:MAG: sodium:proton antiporter [Alphaproteobacteria bacterium]
MSLFDIAAIVVGLSAIFALINHRWFRLPATVGLFGIALGASLVVLLADLVWPGLQIATVVRSVLLRIDLHDVLMEGLLSFLLFAGALHVDYGQLVRRRWAIGALATLGVLLSTALIGGAVWALSALAGMAMPFIWALVFGALISPTDPVAVLGILKESRVPASLEAKLAGESLFNDGIGIVVFTILLAVAVSGAGNVTTLQIGGLFLQEAVGGAVLGLGAGWLANRALAVVNDHSVEILITLATVMVTYAVALALHLSGPIAMVLAGLLIGNKGVQFAMSETSRNHVLSFWTVLDELLNSVLFLLIGAEVLIIALDFSLAAAALATIPVVLIARLVSVWVPIRMLAIRQDFTPGAVPILVWGGLRGGIAVALALSIPENDVKPAILAMTYSVVLFSILVQGLTVTRLVARVIGSPAAPR